MLVELFQQLKKSLAQDIPQRVLEKSTFIENRVINLQNQNLSDQELSTKVNNYLQYNSQGVFNTLAFNSKLSPELKPKILDRIVSNASNYDLNMENLYYSNLMHDGVKAFFNENQQPKIAIITTGNDMESAKVVPFVDREELRQIIRITAIDDCFEQFKKNEMDNGTLVGNLIKVCPTRDEAFNRLLVGVNFDIDQIKAPLINEFDIATQLDKSLRTVGQTIIKSELAMINYLHSNGELESYQNSRINKHSILPDDAQKKLMLALEQERINQAQRTKQSTPDTHEVDKPQQIETIQNEITPLNNGIRIHELAKEHETLFTKVHIGDNHYWENSEKTVKIHPEKISVPKVSRDSVELALSAATSNFGKTISVRGSDEFIEHVLTVLSTNEKYKDVNLSNEKIQTQLNERRGVKPIANELAAAPIPPENIITQDTQKPHSAQSELKTELPITSTPPPAPFYIYSIETRNKLPVATNQDVLNYFKNNYPESSSILQSIEQAGKVKVPGAGGVSLNLSENNPIFLTKLLCKQLDQKFVICNNPAIINKVEKNVTAEMLSSAIHQSDFDKINSLLVGDVSEPNQEKTQQKSR